MSRPPRLKDFDYRGLHRVFLTICTRYRNPFFRDGSLVSRVTSKFLQTAGEHDVEVTTYCVMPDHVHILTTGLTDTADLTGFVKIAKQKTGFEHRAATQKHLWQEGFYDHVLREEDAMAGVISYIIRNPVRAGLARSAQTYDFWGSQTYSREELLEFIVGVDEWIPEWKRKSGRV